MPITAKLSRRFYDTVGDELANELVEWFNQVDATYRADLRELNELNFARFDAKLEQRIALLEAKLEQRVGELDAKLEQRIAQLRAEFRDGIAALESKLETKLERRITDLIKWMLTSLQRQTSRAAAISRE
jgi:hypothetical protein